MGRNRVWRTHRLARVGRIPAYGWGRRQGAGAPLDPPHSVLVPESFCAAIHLTHLHLRQASPRKMKAILQSRLDAAVLGLRDSREGSCSYGASCRGSPAACQKRIRLLPPHSKKDSRRVILRCRRQSGASAPRQILHQGPDALIGVGRVSCHQLACRLSIFGLDCLQDLTMFVIGQLVPHSCIRQQLQRRIEL